MNSYFELQKSVERIAANFFESDELNEKRKGKQTNKKLDSSNSPSKKNYQYRAPLPVNKN